MKLMVFIKKSIEVMEISRTRILTRDIFMQKEDPSKRFLPALLSIIW
jgi:hypothetical protein